MKFSLNLSNLLCFSLISYVFKANLMIFDEFLMKFTQNFTFFLMFFLYFLSISYRNKLHISRVPRTRAEIRAYLGIASAQYALQRYLEPLVRSGAIRMTLPDKPRSHRQQFIAADSRQE